MRFKNAKKLHRKKWRSFFKFYSPQLKKPYCYAFMVRLRDDVIRLELTVFCPCLQLLKRLGTTARQQQSKLTMPWHWFHWHKCRNPNYANLEVNVVLSQYISVTLSVDFRCPDLKDSGIVFTNWKYWYSILTDCKMQFYVLCTFFIHVC